MQFGINQTHHKVFLEVDASIGILTPYETFKNEIHSDVLLTEAIILGEVPSSYYNFYESDDVKSSLNFVE